VDFFHKTCEKSCDEIVQSQHIKPTCFAVEEYLDSVLPCLDGSFKFPQFVHGMRQIVYLGNGVYCFDNQIAAYKYGNEQIECPKVVKVNYSDDYSLTDFDSPEVLLKLDNIFSDGFLTKISKRVFDDEDLVKSYKILTKRVLEYLHKIEIEEKEFPQMFTIIIFLLEQFANVPSNESPDVIKKKFSEYDFPYFVIRNTEKIKRLCR
jgi:hypothetical protein